MIRITLLMENNHLAGLYVPHCENYGSMAYFGPREILSVHLIEAGI